MQTVLHALFLPTPFKRALLHLANATAAADTASLSADSKDKAAVPKPSDVSNSPVEILKPGALYRECSIVTLPVPPLPPAPDSEESANKAKKEKKQKDEDELLEIEQDSDYGGESVGRLVWEWYENHLKEWEAREKKERPELYETKDKKDQESASMKADGAKADAKTAGSQ